jgi:hypothetical protein
VLAISTANRKMIALRNNRFDLCKQESPSEKKGLLAPQLPFSKAPRQKVYPMFGITCELSRWFAPTRK